MKKILEILNEKNFFKKRGVGDIFGYIGDHKECRNIVGNFFFNNQNLKTKNKSLGSKTILQENIYNKFLKFTIDKIIISLKLYYISRGIVEYKRNYELIIFTVC